MKNLFIRCQLIAMAAGLATVFATGAAAQETIYSTLGSGDTFDTTNSVIFSGGVLDGFADRFTSPVTANVGAALLAIDAVSAGTSIRLSIYSNGGEVPGNVIGTFAVTTLPTEPGVVTFEAISNFQLDAGTEYWLTATGLIGAGSNDRVNWFDNDQGIENLKAQRMGATWGGEEVPSTALAFAVETAPEPGSLALGITGLVILGFGRRHIHRTRKRP